MKLEIRHFILACSYEKFWFQCDHTLQWETHSQNNSVVRFYAEISHVLHFLLCGSSWASGRVSAWFTL